MPIPLSSTTISTVARPSRGHRDLPGRRTGLLDRMGGIDDQIEEDLVDFSGQAITAANPRPRSISDFAPCFHSLRLTAKVFSMARLRSTATFSRSPGWENSFIAKTILATCPTPSSDWLMAGDLVQQIVRIGFDDEFLQIFAFRRIDPEPCRATKPIAIQNLQDRLQRVTRKRRLSPIYWMGVLISWAIPAAS